MASPLVSALRNPRFLKLWLGQCVSALGDRFTQMALLSLVIAGQASAVQARLNFCDYLPWLLFGPFAGLLVDRLSKKGLMIAADLVRAALVLGIVAQGLARPEDLPRAYPLLLVMGLMMSVFSPAKSAALPEIVAPEQVLPANALLSATGVISMAVGGVLAGWVLDHWGYRACLGLDALSFVVSAVSVAWIAFPPRAARPAASFQDVARDLGEGFREIRRNGELAKICAFLVVFWAAAISVQVMAPNFGKEALHLSEAQVQGRMTQVGELLALSGLGLLAGAGATAVVGHRVARRAAYGFAAAGMGVALFALAASRTMPGALTFLFLAGFTGGTLVSRLDADILKVIAPEIRGRVFGATSVLFAAAVLVPLLPVGWLSEHMRAVDVIRILAAVLCGLGVMVFWRLAGDLKDGKSLILPAEGRT